MKTPQFELFHEDVYSALRTCVDALGGPKKVGVALWGSSKTPRQQADKLLNCLNRNHAQKLSLDELQWILRSAREIGCHAGINQICRDAAYLDPSPVEPEDEKAALQRQFIDSVGTLQVLARRIQATGERAK